MINAKEFYDVFYDLGIEFYTGVPDKKLARFCANIDNSQASFYSSKNNSTMYKKSTIQHVPAASEDNAISIATGHYLATGKCPVVYMPNSGLWTSLNPLYTLADKNIFSIPMMVLIVLDSDNKNLYTKRNIELTENFVKKAKYNYCKISSDTNFEEEIVNLYNKTMETSSPSFILVESETLDYSVKYVDKKFSSLSKHDVLEYILSFIGKDDIIVASSGNISNEIYNIREEKKQSHKNDLLINGAHGQASSVAYGIAISSPRNVYCIDGDGSFLRDLGGLTTAVQNTQRNLKYILIDDGSYSTTGGQKTPLQCLDTKKMLKSMGMKNTVEAHTYEDIKLGMLRIAKEKSVLIVKVYDNKMFDAEYYGSPSENKKNIMESLTPKDE